jgi:quercetin dioxygenase-like cupin family protein
MVAGPICPGESDGVIIPQLAGTDRGKTTPAGFREEEAASMYRVWNPEDMKIRLLAPGVSARIASGDKLMFSLVTLEPNAVVPEHSHPHEQMGMMVSGEMELTVAGETRRLKESDIYLVPGGIPHKVVTGPHGAVALDAFSPPREEYR